MFVLVGFSDNCISKCEWSFIFLLSSWGRTQNTQASVSLCLIPPVMYVGIFSLLQISTDWERKRGCSWSKCILILTVLVIVNETQCQ